MARVHFENKPDAERVCERLDAWWNRQIVDRACIEVWAPKPGGKPWPAKRHATMRDRWMDVEYQVECALCQAENTYFAGETLPIFHPNLGPEVMTGAMGAPIDFGEHTSWSEPIMHDWSGMSELRFDPANEYWQCILSMTRLGLEAGKGKFLTGITDLHPGGDLAASLRDPQQFAIDCAMEPEQVRALMDHLRPTFYEAYDSQYELIRAAGQPFTTSWLPLWAEGRYYIPSNDFSCMVSSRMFADYFLAEIEEEIEWLDRSIYHLDGPDALRHLDALLDIGGLGGIQWVYGAGAGPASRWLDVLKLIQAAGKNIHVDIEPGELDRLMQELNPEGVMFSTWTASPEEADALVAKVARWTKAGKY